MVISLLEPHEISELGLSEEAGLCEQRGMTFTSFPIPDRGVPSSLRETDVIARTIADRVREGKSAAVHCRAGIGRSALIIACALAYLGITPQAAFAMIGQARGVPVPDTDAQRDWVAAFHDWLTSRS